MRSIVSSLGLMGVLLGLAMPASAEVLLKAGATETKLVTVESHRSLRHRLVAEAGQTVAITLKLANNNPGIVSRVAVYAAGTSTPIVVNNQVNYRIVDPTQKSPISHLIVLTLPGESDSGSANYEIEPLFNYNSSPIFEVEGGTEVVNTLDGVMDMPSTVRYRMIVETATISQQLLLDAQAQQVAEDYEGAIALYTRAINLNPDIADFYAERGNAYLALGEQMDIADRDTTVQQAMVTDWEMAAQLYEQVGHSHRAHALRHLLKQFAQ